MKYIKKLILEDKDSRIENIKEVFRSKINFFEDNIYNISEQYLKFYELGDNNFGYYDMNKYRYNADPDNNSNYCFAKSIRLIKDFSDPNNYIKGMDDMISFNKEIYTYIDKFNNKNKDEFKIFINTFNGNYYLLYMISLKNIDKIDDNLNKYTILAQNITNQLHHSRTEFAYNTYVADKTEEGVIINTTEEIYTDRKMLGILLKIDKNLPDQINITEYPKSKLKKPSGYYRDNDKFILISYKN